MHDTLRLCYRLCKGCIEVYNTALEMDIAKSKLMQRLAKSLKESAMTGAMNRVVQLKLMELGQGLGMSSD